MTDPAPEDPLAAPPPREPGPNRASPVLRGVALLVAVLAAIAGYMHCVRLLGKP